MPSTFDFVNNNIIPPEQKFMNQPVYTQPTPPQPTPVVTVEPGGLNFSTIGEDNSADKMVIDVPQPNVDVGLPAPAKRGRKRNTPAETSVNGNEIIRAEGTVEDKPTISSYYETANLLKNTIDQVDMVAAEVKHELDSVRTSRTFKGKYNVMVGLTGNLSELLQAKIGAIKEMNNCISKSNDLDYKIRKDRKDAEAGLGDDKMIMDLYQAIVQNPAAMQQQQIPSGSNLGIVRAPEPGSKPGETDQGYLNFLANMNPEQNLMIMQQQNPDIKQCVVFDAATGNRWFQVMNTKTGQPIPGAPTLDPMFLEDVTLDTRNNLAKNLNLGQTYPLIILNNDVTKEY